MNLSTNKNINGELVDLDQACSITNLGRNTVRNLASSAGAIRKIGRCSRIRKDILLNYIEENCKHITLTTEEAVDLEMYFALTHQRITDEIEVWESLKDNPTAPAAGKNLIFWKKMETLINRVSKELR